MAQWSQKDGWLIVPYSGPEMVTVEIGVDGVWTVAYFDFEDGQRVVKIRRDARPGSVQVRQRPA